MQITLFESKDEKIHTEIIAIYEFGKIIVSGYDQYLPTPQLPQGSEYVYETMLDSISTRELVEIIAPNQSEVEVLEKMKEMFGGKGADIRFQAFCVEHEIETYCSSEFDD
ncbi:MAG: hypothetical protein PUC65_08035 [Clostridiales bacterium]|nr:hypothetical protein [Clostridiales bacterium]